MYQTLLKKQVNFSVFNNCFKFLFVIIGFLSITKSNAQVNPYTVDQLQMSTMTLAPTYTVLPVGKTVLVTSASLDNFVTAAPVALPFTFNFGGTNYTSLNVSMHGFVTFGATAPALTEVTPISSAAGYSGAISVFGQDLDMLVATNNISYYYDAPNNVFKIEWNVKRSTLPTSISTPDGTTNMLFQLWLYSNNVIEMRYNPTTIPSITGLNAQIGLRGTANTDYKNLAFNPPVAAGNNWPALPATMTAGASNAATVYTRSTSSLPLASNRVFRFTPVTCNAPSGFTIAPYSITNNDLAFSWAVPSPVPTLGYEYEVRTSGAAGSGGVGLVTTGTTAGLTLPSMSAFLAASTNYCIYVRSLCTISDTSAWSASTCFTTLCNPSASLPPLYYLDFEGPVVPLLTPFHSLTLPACTTKQNAGLGNNWVVTDSNKPIYSDSGMIDNILMYNGQNPTNGNPANAWFYTEGLSLIAGTSYTLSYFYGGTSTPSTVINKMKVAFGTYPDYNVMTNLLDNHIDIKSSPSENYVTFTAPTTATYYIGFNAYSAASNGQLYVDDVQVVLSQCLKPTAVTVSAIAGSTATVSWTAPTPVPVNGYEYYISTSGTPPTNSTPISGTVAVPSVNLVGLTGLTNYCFWVRSKCAGLDRGEWVALSLPSGGCFTTLVQINYCSSTSTGNLNFFTNFATTGCITNVSNPTGYSVNGYGDYTGLIITQSQSGVVNITTAYNSMAGGVGVAVWGDWNQNGVFDATERMYNSAAFLTAPPAISFTVPGSALLGYTRLRIVVDWNLTNPLACGVMTRGETEDYSFNVVTPPPPLTLSINSSLQCIGDPTPGIVVTQGLASYDTFTWSPSAPLTVTGVGSVGNPYILSTLTAQVFTLTACQSFAPFRCNTVQFTYNANLRPTPITISTPSGTVACQEGSTGPAIPLVASGGVVSGFPILSETFNSGAPGWTNINTSTAGNPAASTWTISPSGSTLTLNGIVISNDNTAFIATNADAQGSGGINDNSLISPVFSLAGYTSAALSFYHAVRFFDGTVNPFARVLISTDGGLTYSPVPLIEWTTPTNSVFLPNIGVTTAQNFSNTILDLTAYVGQTNLRIKFSHHDKFGWIWAIDNFLVSGSASSAVNWNTLVGPVGTGVAVPGLYTTAAATTPYLAGSGAATVYALPNANTTYTATASTPAPVCTATASVAITIVPIVGGTAAGGNQTICSGSPANIMVTGYSGTISSWQSSANIGFTTPTTIGNITNTLTSTDMGVITANTYYRAVITNGVCTAYSLPALVTYSSTSWNPGPSWSNGVPDATKAAIFNTNYLSPGSLTACSVKVNAGTVTFLANQTLTVQGTVNVAGGSLVFNNNASLLQPNNVTNGVGVATGGNTGNITYRRTTTPISAYDYTYWSSPVAGLTLSAMSPLTTPNRFYTYNPFTDGWFNAPDTTVMVAGVGYIARAPDGSPLAPATTTQTANFVGIPHNGTFTSPLLSGSPTPMYNLIGNPYPSALDFDVFITDPANSFIDGTIYLWTHNTPISATYGYDANDYASYNATGGIGTAAPNPGINNTNPTKNIASGQGFIVLANSNTAATFKNNMRVAGTAGANSNFYRDQPNTISTLEKHRVWLDIFNDQGGFKRTLVGYVENATNDMDSSFDGYSASSNVMVSMYSLVGTNQLGIQGRALPFNVNDVVPLGYMSQEATSYTIKLSDFDGLFETQDVYLEDKLLNIVHNLKTSDYSFTTAIGTFNDRFELRYTDSALSTSQNEFSNANVIVYKDNQNVQVKSSNVLISAIKVYDISGRELYNKKDINANKFVISNLNSSQQVLLVKVTSVDGKTVVKNIIF